MKQFIGLDGAFADPQIKPGLDRTADYMVQGIRSQRDSGRRLMRVSTAKSATTRSYEILRPKEVLKAGG
jgi:hypothetical protein